MRHLMLGTVLTVLIGTTGWVWGGYADLKQQLEDYTPPAWLHQQSAAQPQAQAETDDFRAARQSIEAARDRWAASISDRPPILAGDAIVRDLIAAAVDNAQTMALVGERFDLGTLQSLILLRNPAVRGATERFRAALEGFGQVAELDAILRQYSAYTAGVMPGVGPMTGMDANIEMRFPFPGITALKGAVAEQNAVAAKASLDIVRRDNIAQGTKAFWNLLYTHQALRITRVTLDRLNQLESVATTRYGAGKTSYQDVVKIRIGRERLEEQLTTLVNQRINLEAELQALIDLPPGSAIGRPAPTSPDLARPDLEALYPLALAHRQELQRMRAMLVKMARMVEMAETMIQPSLSQNYSLYADKPVMQAGSAAMQPTFSTSIAPVRGRGLPKNAWFGTRDAYLRETRRKVDALRADLADAEARTRLMIRQGWFELDRALRERALYRSRLLELAETSLDVSTRGYESGNVSFADVIASYTTWLDINLASQRRNSDVGIARIELARRVGKDLSPQPERTTDHVR